MNRMPRRTFSSLRALCKYPGSNTTPSVIRCSRSFSVLNRRYDPNNEQASGEIRSPLDMRGKNIIVTGGGRGIGLSICRAIAENGGNVAVIDALNEPDKEFDALKKFDVIYTRADVSQEKSLVEGFQQSIESLGRVDGCVTAAGICLDKPFLEHEWDESLRIQMVNTMGTFYSAKLAAEQMKKQGNGGSILMICSITAHNVAPGHQLSAYSASKGAVRSLGPALSVELAPHRIRVNTISPGYIETPMTKTLGEQYPHLLKLFHSAPPLGRMGKREDLTGAALYYLSDASTYTTATDLLITGGLHAGRN